VISVSQEARNVLDTIYESYYDEQSQMVDWESAFENEHVRDWQRELVNDVDRVETGFGVTIIAIPSESSAVGCSDMEVFINTVHSPRLREPLERAISGNEHYAILKMCYWTITLSVNTGSCLFVKLTLIYRSIKQFIIGKISLIKVRNQCPHRLSQSSKTYSVTINFDLFN
jgi:hypothetical protein